MNEHERVETESVAQTAAAAGNRVRRFEYPPRPLPTAAARSSLENLVDSAECEAVRRSCASEGWMMTEEEMLLLPNALDDSSEAVEFAGNEMEILLLLQPRHRQLRWAIVGFVVVVSISSFLSDKTGFL